MRERVTAGAPFASAVVGAILLVLAAVIFVNSRGFGYDYAAYDAAARRIASGVALYLPGTAEAYARGAYEGLYLYPPPLAIALVPLTGFDEHTATLLWMAVRIALLVVGCAVLPVGTRVRLLNFAVACISFPVLFDLNLGNVSIVVFALSALAWRLDGRLASAIVHAVLVAIRFPFGIFFALWLAQRRFGILLATVFAGAALIALSLPIVGVGTYQDYVTILRSLPDISTGEHNLSIRGTVAGLGLGDPTLTAVTLVGYALGLGAVLFAGLHRDRHVAFVMTAVATLVVSPFIHPHYLVLLLLPAALLAERGQSWGLLLPLTGWLPDPVLPFVAPITLILLGLLPAGSATALPSASSPAVRPA
jgi:Glycosyltransferase family 87